MLQLARFGGVTVQLQSTGKVVDPSFSGDKNKNVCTFTQGRWQKIFPGGGERQ